MDLEKRHVVVVGLGRSGLAAAILCLRKGATVTVNDSRDATALASALEELQEQAEKGRGELKTVLGDHPHEVFSSADLVVLSPGVPRLPAVDAARAAGVAVIGELELGFRFIQADVVGITGTNGKSTTTSLVGAMLAASKPPVFVGGNLGEPLCEAINRGDPALGPGGIAVLEISSFQLETVETFRAHVAALLNLSEDHLDRYDSYDDYIAAKARLFERQQATDYSVGNADPGQARARGVAATSEGTVFTFRSQRSWGSGAWYDTDKADLCVRLPHCSLERYDRSLLSLPGLHNVQNALAALLVARLSGADEGCCREALSTFQGLPHRMQLVGDKDGVRYYNDSKATNVGSVVGSLTGFERPVVLIAGGTDKGGDYAPLRPMLEEVCTNMVLIGAAADTMASALSGSVPIHRADSLADAVQQAADLAQAGDAVVLSPACSSFDMFKDYVDRGNHFAAAVQRTLASEKP